MSDGSRPIEGWKDIAAAAGVSEDTVQRASRRPFDPLPVWYSPFDAPITTRAAMEAWMKRNTLPAHAYHALREHGLHPSQRGPDGQPFAVQPETPRPPRVRRRMRRAAAPSQKQA